jgi:GAF domain-containing protein
MSKNKDFESRLQRTEQQLALFQKISRFMVREMSLTEVLQGIVSLVVEFSRCDSCLVYLLQDQELVLCASNTPHPSTIGKVRRRDEGLTRWVARTPPAGDFARSLQRPDQNVRRAARRLL